MKWSKDCFHPYVESWFVKVFQSGLIELVINTTERNLMYFATNDNMIIVHRKEDLEVSDFDLFGTAFEKYMLEIPSEVLPFENGISYMLFQQQEKDQIYFLFVPFDMLRKPKQTILGKDFGNNILENGE